MKRFPISSALISVHCHATEDEEKVLKALGTLLPDGAEVKRTVLEGHHGNPITVFSSRVNDEKMLRKIWERTIETFTRANAADGVKNRMDESCSLFFRFDKQAAFEGILKSSSGGESITLKLKVTAYPAKPEIAIRNLLDTLR